MQISLSSGNRCGQGVSTTASIICLILQNKIMVAIIPWVKFVYMGCGYMMVGSVVPKTCDWEKFLRILLGYMQNCVYNPGINQSENQP